MLKQSDLIGIINLLVSMLLSEGSYGKIPGKVLPQTVLTLTMVSLKFLNNVARLNLDLLQVSQQFDLFLIFYFRNRLARKIMKILFIIYSIIS